MGGAYAVYPAGDTLKLGHDANEVAEQRQRKPITYRKTRNWEVAGLEFSFKLSPSITDVQVFGPPRNGHSMESYT